MESKPSTTRVPLLAALAAFAVHTLVRAALIFGPTVGGPSAADEVRFHLPAIAEFVSAWPDVDLSDYPAAATPGHHLVLAALDRSLSLSDNAMRLVSGAPISLLLALVVWRCARRVGVLCALALALPLACSPHTLSFSTLVLPESSAWLFVGALLMLALREKLGVIACAVGGVLLLGAVGVRQMTLWCAAPLWVGAWLASAPLRAHTERVLPERIWPVEALGSRVRGFLIAFACTLPAFGLVAWFVRLWGGLVPPTFQTSEAAGQLAGGVVNQGFSPSAPAFMLVLIGIMGAFYVPTLWRPLLERRRAAIRWGVLLGIATLVLGLLPATSYSQEDGRWSGLWSAARLLPTFADRSLFIVGGVCAGGVLVAWTLVVPTPARVRWVVLGALVASMAAHAAGAQVFQRYMEPLVLILLPLCVASSYEGRDDTPSRWSLVGPLALAALTGVLAVRLIGAPVPA